LSFLLSLFLVALTTLLIIQWSGFSRSSFYDNMSKNAYYDNLAKDIKSEAESITLPSGLPLTVLDGLFTPYSISKDVNGYVDATFKGKVFNPDTTEMESKLQNNALQALKDTGVNPTEEQQTNLKDYIVSIRNVYIDKVKVPLLSYFNQARTVYEKIFIVGVIACLICIFISTFAIIKLHRWLHRALRYLIYSTAAAGLMVGIVPWYIMNSGFYKRIHLSPEYFYNFFVDYVTNILMSFIYFSIVWLVISIVMACGVKMIKKSKANLMKKG
jgi:hypothetical protein